MKIGIIGLGLIGGSAAKAAKRQGDEIIAYDCCAETLQNAKQQGVIDHIAATPAECASASLVLLAMPVMAIEESFATLAPYVSATTTLTDTGSTKQQILAAAKTHLRDNACRFVPAHPITGNENSTFAAADAALFDNQPIILCTDEADADAIATADDFWQRLGGRTTHLAADKHDAFFALISHLPHVLSYTLVHHVSHHPEQQELFSYAGSGFQDFVRIAGSSPEMWRDICMANRSQIVAALNDYQKHLSQFTQYINDGDADSLLKLFDACRQKRQSTPTTQKPQ